MQPEMALEKFNGILSEGEKEEILEFPFVYYAGQNARNMQRRTNVGYNFNGGYDDDHGFYHAVVGDHLAFRYEIAGSLGSGACGQVVKCYDHKHERQVAVKIIRNIPLFKELAQQEVKISKFLSKPETDNHCVVNLLNDFEFRHHPCMVFELLGSTLYELLQLNQFKGLSEDVVREFCVEMLQSLSLLRQNKIVHCDIKPQNILLFNRHCNCNDITTLANDTSSCPEKETSLECFEKRFIHPPEVIGNLTELGMHHLKLIDFGCSSRAGQCRFLYVQSRYYRAPEVILGTGYNCPIDMWSFACVAAELITGTPIFAGENETDQLTVIMEVLGLPPESLLSNAKKVRSFFDAEGVPRYCKVVLEDGLPVMTGGKSPSGNPRGLPGSKDLKSVLGKCVSDVCVQFLRACLQWEPEARLSPATALQHAWFCDRRHIILRKRSFTT